MRYIGSVIVYCCSIICVVAVSILLWAITFEMTALNGDMLRSWFMRGHVYTNLTPDLLQMTIPEDKQGNKLLSNVVVTQAFTQTFSPKYIADQTEEVLDGVFAWSTGHVSPLEFNGPIQERKREFADRLAAALEPRIAALPLCRPTEEPSLDHLACIPDATSTSEFARQVMTHSISNLTIVTTAHPPAYPATVNRLAAGESMWFDDIEYYRPLIEPLLMWLPVLIAGSLLSMLAIARQRLSALSRLGKWLSIGASLMLTLGLTIVYIALDPAKFRTFRLNPAGDEVTLLIPFVQQVLQGVGLWLCLLSGGAVLTGLIMWYSLGRLANRSGGSINRRPAT